MLQNRTCKSCHYFEADHGMCTQNPILTSVGPMFAQRTPDSPACWFGFVRKPKPGELTEIFKKMKIHPELGEEIVIETVEPFVLEAVG